MQALFNNIAGAGHLAYLKEAVEDNVNMPCLGGIKRNSDITIPERHLGLVTEEDHPLLEKNSKKLADIIEESLDIDLLVNKLPDINFENQWKVLNSPTRKSFVRIGVAVDNAFCFYYQDNLDLLKENGAQLVFFSPVNDHNLPADLDGLYFGGGYPELFAKKLAGNKKLRNQILKESQNGMPIYGECGGFMYLCKDICDFEGNTYDMANCFSFSTAMFPKLKALGYREITLTKDTVIGQSGFKIRGHEFHYSGIKEPLGGKDMENVYKTSDRLGRKKMLQGFQINNTLGSYGHLHFASCPGSASSFVGNCLNYRHERG